MHADSPVLSLRGPEDIIAAIPYLLGFHPDQSLVLVGLDERRIIVTARIDLDDATATVMESTAAAIARGGAHQLIAVIYEPGIASWRDLADTYATILTTAAAAGLDVRDCLAVRAGRWRSLECVDPACCPPAGRGLPTSPSVIDAAAAVAGLYAEPDREAVAAELDPVPGRDLLVPALRAAESVAAKADVRDQSVRHDQLVIDALIAAYTNAADRGQFPDDADTARFGVALCDIAVRDTLWLTVDDKPNDALWRNLARRLPPPYDVAPLFLYAWASWRNGRAMLAGIAVERALDADPDNTAAALLHTALVAGLNPQHIPPIRSHHRSAIALNSLARRRST